MWSTGANFSHIYWHSFTMCDKSVCGSLKSFPFKVDHTFTMEMLHFFHANFLPKMHQKSGKYKLFFEWKKPWFFHRNAGFSGEKKHTKNWIVSFLDGKWNSWMLENSLETFFAKDEICPFSMQQFLPHFPYLYPHLSSKRCFSGASPISAPEHFLRWSS